MFVELLILYCHLPPFKDASPNLSLRQHAQKNIKIYYFLKFCMLSYVN
jgi:hypothetical protein